MGGMRFLALVLTAVLVGPASAVRLDEIRFSSNEDRFRLVLDLSGETSFRERLFEDPYRIAINLAQTSAANLTLPEVEDWMVEGIRFNQLRGATAQIVLDVSEEPSYDVFALPAEDGRPDRVVCDVYRQRDRGSARGPDEWVVVIDPGHGGRDPGVVSREPALLEKDVVLDVSKRLRDALEREPGVRARLTREQDVRLGLRDRVVRAQAMSGDVFVSIHVNGCPSHSARGAEVFFLSLQGASGAAASELAQLENSADPTLDPMLGEIADLPFAVDLLQTDTILRSSLLAEVMLEALGNSRLAAARGVKQANFAVLRSCRLPSALVELGFITNPEDARQLRSSSHRQALAETLARGLLEFRHRYARHSSEEDG